MEVKLEIPKIIESLPESILTEVLTYLQDIKKAFKSGDVTALHLRTILQEDHKLLQELAK